MFEPRELIDKRYQIVKELGKGGMGIVYLALDTESGEQVALKVLLLPPGESHLRFRREFRVMSRLNHPNIVRVKASGSYDELPYLVMAYVPGQTLQEAYAGGARDGGDVAVRLELALQIADALHYVHTLGIVHRDLKPDNVMLEPLVGGGERVLLMDFGLAKGEHRDSLLVSDDGAVVGTANYMSPEQIQGRSVDARSDLYAFGCLLYWLLTGQPPFQGESVALTMVQQLQNPPTPPSHRNPVVGRGLDDLVLNLLEKDPSDRYSAASDVIAALRAQQGALGEAPPERVVDDITDSAAPKRLLQPPLIGREAAWREVHQALREMQTLHGRVIGVEAEAGGGLSRFLKETLREARAQNILTLQINHHDGVAIPYQAWRQGLLRFRRRYPEAFAAASAGLAEELEPLLPELRGDQDHDPERNPDDDPASSTLLPASAVQLRLYEALDTLIARLSRTLPLAVLIDNVQAAGEESVGLLAYLVRGRSGQQALFVLGLHPEQLAAATRQTLRTLGAEQLRLEPLDDAAMRELLAVQLGGELAEGLEHYLLERAGGNPFFAEELLLALLGDERIGRQLGVWSWRGDPGGVPQRLEDVFARRLAPLSAFAGRALRVASSIGRDFDFGLLQTLLGSDEDSLLDAVDELLRARLVEERSAERYRFSHVLLRETLHEQLSQRRRERYHEQIAERLRQRPDTPPEQLAEHYAETARPERAFGYALSAARSAAALFANNVAAHYYRLALAVGIPKSPHDRSGTDDPDVPDTTDITDATDDIGAARLVTARFELGDILERIGRWEEAEALYHALAQDAEQEVRALHRLGGLAQRRGDLGASRDYLERARALAPRDPAICSTLGRTLTLSSDLGRAEEVLEHALTLAAAQGGAAALQAHVDLAELDYHRSRWAEAIERLEPITQQCQDSDLSALRAKTDNLLGSAHRKLGNLSVAEEHYRRALESFQKIGEVERALSVLQNLSNIYATSGDHQRAMRTDEEVRKRARRLGDDKHQAIAAANLGEEHLKLGHYDTAEPLLREAYELFDRAGLVHYEVYARLNLVACYVRQQQEDAARSQLGEVEQHLAAAPQRYYQALYTLRCGEVALRTGQPSAALEHLQDALATFRDLQSQEDLLEGCLLQAEAHLALRQHDRCRAVLESAAELTQGAHQDILSELQIAYLRALNDHDDQSARQITLELDAHALGHAAELTQRSLRLQR